MSGFKGIRNNEGRPKGSTNKNTNDIRNNFKMLIENNIDNLQADLDSLEPRERLKVIIDLSKFILPQLKAVEVTTEKNESTFQPIIIQLENEANSN